MEQNMNKPAFPTAEDHTTANGIPWTAGMTLREYYAGLAMQGILAADRGQVVNVNNVAYWAVAQADALIVALEPIPSQE